MKKPEICIMTGIPGLVGMIEERCGSMASKITQYNPGKNIGDASLLQSAEVIVTDPWFCGHWLYGLPNVEFVQLNSGGIDRSVQELKPPECPHELNI